MMFFNQWVKLLLLLSFLSVGGSTFDNSAEIKLLSIVDSILEVPQIHSNLIQDGFMSRFFLNDSGVEISNLRSALYTHIRTMPSSFYHIWSGFENGAFIGYYQDNTVLASEYTLAYQSDENHSCAYNYSSVEWKEALNVTQSKRAATFDPDTNTLSSHCLEIFKTEPDTGAMDASLDGVVFDCRKRPWYYETKQAGSKEWTSIFVDAVTNKPALARCAPLLNQTTRVTSYPGGLEQDQTGMIGVACVGLYLQELSQELLIEFGGELYEANPGVFIVERSTGKLVGASDSNFDDVYDNETQSQRFALDTASDVIRFATTVITNYSESIGASTWPNDFSTVAWVRNVSSSFPSLKHEAYYISSVYYSRELDWDLVAVQYVSCSEGYFIDTESYVCSECVPPFSSTGTSAASCDTCIEGYFMDKGNTCKLCPKGAICRGDSSTEDIELKMNYWRIASTSLTLYKCPYDESCAGGSDFNQGGDSYCENGYRGPLCSLCEVGRYLSESEQCVDCNEAGSVMIRFIRSPRLLIFTLIVLFLLSFFIYYNLYCLNTPLYAEDFLSENIDEDNNESQMTESQAVSDFRKDILRLEADSDSYAINDLDGSVTFTETNTKNLPESTTQTIEVKHSNKAMFTVNMTVTTQTEERVVTKTTVVPSSIVAMIASKMLAMQVKIKALTSYMQIAVSVGFNCAVTFPTMFDSTLSTLKFVTLDLISALGLNCRFHKFDYIHRLMVMTITPVIISIVLLCMYGLSALIHEVFKRDGPSKAHLASYEVPDSLKGSFKVREINNFKRVFAYLDRHQTGNVTQTVLEKAVAEFEPDLYPDQVATKVASMMSEASKHHDGSIHFDEFLFAIMMARRRHNGTNFSILVDKVEAKVNREYGQTIFFVFLFLTFLVLAGNSTALFHFLKCDRFPDGNGSSQRYLSTDYSINCDGKRYQSYIPFASVMIIVYPVGIPLMYFFLLWEHRVVLRDQAALDREEATGFPTIGHLTFLVSAYKPEFYWFEVLESLRRLMLASLIGIANVGLASTPVIGLLISLVFVWVFTSLKPFKESDDNGLGVILAFSITLIFLGALMIKVDLDTYNQAEAASFDFLLLLVLFAGPMVLIINIIIGDPENVKDFVHGTYSSSNDRRRSARSVEQSYLNSIKAEMKVKEENQKMMVEKTTAAAAAETSMARGNRFRWPWDRRGGRHNRSPVRVYHRQADSLDRAPGDTGGGGATATHVLPHNPAEGAAAGGSSSPSAASSSEVGDSRSATTPQVRPVGVYAPKARQIQVITPETELRQISPARSKHATSPPPKSPTRSRNNSPSRKQLASSPKDGSAGKKKKKGKPKLQLMNEITASGVL